LCRIFGGKALERVRLQPSCSIRTAHSLTRSQHDVYSQSSLFLFSGQYSRVGGHVSAPDVSTANISTWFLDP